MHANLDPLKINTFLLVFISCSLLLALSSCNAAKSAKGDKKVKERSSEYVLKKANPNKKMATWFNAKALINYKDDYQGIKISSNIFIKKDSIIWLNIKKFGFEAVRVQITPDSIYILDRINKKYITKDLDYITQQFKLPSAISETLDFKGIQDIFIGNPVFIPVKKMNAAAELDGRYRLYGEYDKVEGNYYFDATDFELMQMTFVDNHTNQNMSLNYSNYEMVEGKGNYSHFRTIDLASNETGAVRMTIDLSELVIDVPKKLKFVVPSTYKAQ